MPLTPLRGLFQAQFLGTFADNAFKLIVALLAVRALGSDPDPGAVQGRLSLAFAVYAIPLVLFSLPAALLADRFAKRTSLVALKGVEVVVMGSAASLLWWDPDNVGFALAALGAMSLQSALFSPVKAAILPELVEHERLSEANGTLQMVIFVACVVGTWAGGALIDMVGQEVGLAVGALFLLSLLGFLAIRQLPASPAPSSAPRPARRLIADAWSALRRDRRLSMGTAGLALAWATLSLLGQNVLAYASDTSVGLGLSERWAGLPLAICGLGAGLGCGLAGWFSRRKVELGLVLLGGAAFSALLGAFTFWMPGLAGTIALTAGAGFAVGFVLVPLEALLQWAAPRRRRGAVLALSNAAVFSGMLIGTLATGWLAALGLEHQGIFAAGTLAALVATVGAVWVLPEALWRAVVVVLTRSIYRLRVSGNVPDRGPALLVANHVSFIDGMMVMAATDRPVRFLVHDSFFERPLIGRVLRSLRAIPVASNAGPRATLRALREAGKALDEGSVVCIFAEGQITRMGGTLPFQRGLERIVGKREVPILPVYLDRLWGSVFSHAGGGFFRSQPRLPYHVSLIIGEAMPSGSSSAAVRRALLELGPTAWAARDRESDRPIRRFVSQVRRAPWRAAFHEHEGPTRSRLQVLAGAVILARRMRRELAEGEPVGIFLPASVGASLLQLAAALAGRTVVPLNFTAGEAALESAVRRAGLRHVFSSRRFLEKAGLSLPAGVQPVLLEDWARPSRLERGWAAAAALLAPMSLLHRLCGVRAREASAAPMAILFSSGSSGEPKGVVLGHANVAANVDAVAQVTRPRDDDALLGVLPPFHAFGNFALWFACCEGMPIAFHANPLDAEAVGKLVERHALTWMLATPTFLQQWSRRCEPGAFGSLRLVVTGAEKLPVKVAEAFERRYGVRPMEGYGATECAPVISLNVPDHRGAGFYQQGSRPGTVGHPLPGVAVQIRHADGAPCEVGEDGEIWVAGPNVMQGYLHDEERSRACLVDGWYRTGDVGSVDADGFLRLSGRLSRFSKIGGEMVPHGTVEDALQEASGLESRSFVVTGVPHPRKGEALVVLHTVDESSLETLRSVLRERGLPNLFIPRRQQFHRVSELPMLGSGKLDLSRAQRMAEEASATPAETSALAT